LLDVCGGLYFGTSVEEQLALMQPAGRAVQHPWGLLRFSCTAEVFGLIREEPHRFPPEHTAYSRPIAGDGLGEAGPRDTLAPNPAGDSHPYPLEIRLPRWTLEQDWDLRNWLFRWGAGLRIEQPGELRALHLQQCRAVVDLYAEAPSH
jgi:hypothetical protein